VPICTDKIINSERKKKEKKEKKKEKKASLAL